MSIGSALRSLRAACGLSQHAAAKLSGVPLPKPRVLEDEAAPSHVKRLLTVYSRALARQTAEEDSARACVAPERAPADPAAVRN